MKIAGRTCSATRIFRFFAVDREMTADAELAALSVRVEVLEQEVAELKRLLRAAQ